MVGNRSGRGKPGAGGRQGAWICSRHPRADGRQRL